MQKIFPAFLSCQGTQLSEAEKKLFSKHNPLGVCLFSKFCANIENAEQVAALVNEIKEVVGREDVLIAVDQEGGRVRRLTESEFLPLAPQESLTTPELAAQHAYLASYDLARCGINVNFAPVLDIITPATAKVLQGRCFKNNVSLLARAMTDEYIKCGICPCVKHLPGHGKASVDPHLELPVINSEIYELETDFAPFKDLCDAPMGMVAHIVLTCIDKDNAATISPTVISEIIRGKINFQGLLVSDAIVMRALQGSIREKAEKAIIAGCEVICLGNADFEANKALCESNIELSDAARERLQKITEICNKKHIFADYEQVKNKYCATLKNILSYDYKYDATEVLNHLRQK